MPNSALLYFHAITSLHPGSGTALGVVDLPVQRERHTGWPVIPGSSIKGVLREVCNSRNGDAGLWEAAFGPAKIDSGSGDAFAGALSFTDARLLAFPVRSLKGVFAWVTCPQAIQRWQRDSGIGGDTVKLPALAVSEGEALVALGSVLKVHTGKESLVLEEFVFAPREENLDFFPFLGVEEKKRLAILNDTDYTYFVKHATEVTARIRLNSETKTVDKGALFYQEFLPAETLLYSVVLGARSRKEGTDGSAEAMLQYLTRKLPEYIQIGGDETTGKGICRVRTEGGA
jgi:CRISPR-associated protein Cmr4